MPADATLIEMRDKLLSASIACSGPIERHAVIHRRRRHRGSLHAILRHQTMTDLMWQHLTILSGG